MKFVVVILMVVDVNNTLTERGKYRTHSEYRRKRAALKESLRIYCIFLLIVPLAGSSLILRQVTP